MDLHKEKCIISLSVFANFLALYNISKKSVEFLSVYLQIFGRIL